MLSKGLGEGGSIGGLHIASDYPGPFSPMLVTKAVQNVISAVDSQAPSQFVLVPRRRKLALRIETIRNNHELHVAHFNPVATLSPFETSRVDWRALVEDWLPSKPKFIHSHKLTFEARIGKLLADQFRVPHIVTVRGSSDTDPRNSFPWMASTYRSILESSAANLWVSAWAMPAIIRKTGYAIQAKDRVFPNGVSQSPPLESQSWTNGAFVCVCRLDAYKQKGVLELLRGFAKAKRHLPHLRMTLVGALSDETRCVLRKFIVKLGLAGAVTLGGHMDRQSVLALIRHSEGLIMVSKRETFGLVYAEALLSGVPVIYLRGSGIDGYSFAKRYGVRSESQSASAISDAIRRFCAGAPQLRSKLHEALRSGDLDYLTLNGQRDAYAGLLREVGVL